MHTENSQRKEIQNINANKNSRPYGYVIAGEVIYLVKDMLLVNISKDSLVRVPLRTTMANLLNYLLMNASNRIVLDDELMVMVWEVYSLRASSHRLWQVMNGLKYKLIESGLDGHTISRADKKGFIISRTTQVIPLYDDENG
jgi:DNA-binding winged helix-turn-helix (wHTH) protein